MKLRPEGSLRPSLASGTFLTRLYQRVFQHLDKAQTTSLGLCFELELESWDFKGAGHQLKKTRVDGMAHYIAPPTSDVALAYCSLKPLIESLRIYFLGIRSTRY